VFIIATMRLFSGDGAGCSARLFKKYGANVTGGLHVRMPDCIGNVKALKKTLEQNRSIVSEAERKTGGAADRLRNGYPTREGLGLFSRIAGLLGQRLWFSGKTREYSDRLHIDGAKCADCGTCVINCPMRNLSLKDR
jgi:hypothetical protein